MKIYLILYFFVVAQPVFGQKRLADMKDQPDPLFPAKRKFNGGLISTYRGVNIPAPVFITDITYGISKKVSAGIVGGTTGQLALMGLRVNALLFERGNFRSLIRFNAIYYPARDGQFLFDPSIKHVMPWMFTMGIADAEWKTKGGTRWTVGIGYLETHCVDGMLKMFHLSKENEQADLPLELYTTAHVGVSIPLSRRLFLRPEMIVVMKGLKPIVTTPDAKASPINPYVNLVYVFGK
jgi:hypothetical protein